MISTDNLDTNLKILVDVYSKLVVRDISVTPRTIEMSSDVPVLVKQGTLVEFAESTIQLLENSYITNQALPYHYSLVKGDIPKVNDQTTFNDPLTGAVKQFKVTVVLGASVRKLNQPVPETLEGVDMNALRLRGRILTPYKGILAPGIYSAEIRVNTNQTQRGKFLLESNVADSITDNETVFGKKILGWFQGYLNTVND